MSKILGGLLMVMTVGCSTAVVRPYVGEQPAWPTSPGSILITRYELPVFTTLPPAPYRVLGELLLESPFYATPEPGQMPVLIKKAKQMGADAIVLVNSSTFFVQGPTIKPTGGAAPQGGITALNAFNPESFRGGVSVVAVQWLNSAPEGMPGKFQKAAPKAPLSPEKVEPTAPAVESTPTPPSPPPAPKPETSPVPAPESKPATPAPVAPPPATPTNAPAPAMTDPRLAPEPAK